MAPVRGAGRGGRGPRRALVVAPGGPQRQLIVGALQDAGYAVLLADALAAAGQCPGGGPSGIVVCDWAVGAAPAAALVAAARARGDGDDACFVIAVVRPGVPGEVEAALAAGADEVIRAPVLPAVLGRRIAVADRQLDLAERLSASRHEVAATLARLQAMQAATETDLEVARQLQQGLMGPHRSRFGEMEVSLLFRPAGHLGGDLVGLFPINARRVALYAIDVCGSGIAAALLAARLAAHLATASGENLVLRLDENNHYEARPPADVARLFNRLMLDDLRGDVYFTMVYLDLDVMSGAGRMVQAGHPHPILQAGDGRLASLGHGGLPVGLWEGADWEEVAFEIGPGARLFIGSDGITEATDPDGKMLAEEGLAAILSTNRFLSGTPLLESLCWSVAQFTRGVRTDDISGILIERDGPR